MMYPVDFLWVPLTRYKSSASLLVYKSLAWMNAKLCQMLFSSVWVDDQISSCFNLLEHDKLQLINYPQTKQLYISENKPT